MPRQSYGSVAGTVLALLGVTGVMTMAVLAPNVSQVLPVIRKEVYRYRRRQYLNQTIERLKRRGLVEWRKRDGHVYLKLTSAGQQELLRYKLRQLEIKRPKKWDKRWRVIIFDIRESRRWRRDAIRQQLFSFGFTRLQNSVWIHLYDGEELIMLLKTSLKLGRELLYLTVEQLENDRWLRARFQLS